MRQNRQTFLGYLGSGLTLVLGGLWVFPLLWTVLTSVKPEEIAAARPLIWISNRFTFASFQEVLANGNIQIWYLNSILTATVITLGTLAISLLAAYAFSRLRFPGRAFLFWLTLIGFMLPFEALLIPLFKLMVSINLLNTYAGVILPQLVSPVAILVFKQFFDQVPMEYREAALIDGAGEFSILWHIYLPLSANIIWAIAIVIFIAAWNNFLWPFIEINSPEKMTVPLGLTQVMDTFGLRYAKLMAAATLGALPIVLGYLLFQKRVTTGFLNATGIKG